MVVVVVCWLQVGYFSKEKSCHDNYNLACILTLPAYQRKVGRLAGRAGRQIALQPLQHSPAVLQQHDAVRDAQAMWAANVAGQCARGLA